MVTGITRMEQARFVGAAGLSHFALACSTLDNLIYDRNWLPILQHVMALQRATSRNLTTLLRGKHRNTFNQACDGRAGHTQHHRDKESIARIISIIESNHIACTRVPMLDAQRPTDDLKGAQNLCVLPSEITKASLRQWQHAITIGAYTKAHASAKSSHWRRHDKTTTKTGASTRRPLKESTSTHSHCCVRPSLKIQAQHRCNNSRCFVTKRRASWQRLGGHVMDDST